MRSHQLFAFALPIALVIPSHAQEWTRFRGPNGTGISTATTIPVQFTPADYNWRVELPGVGHSSPVLWGNKIFLSSADDGNGKRHIFCLDAATGKRLWIRTYDFSKYARHKYNSFASSTAAVDEERVYYIWGTPESFVIYAADHNGKELWQRDLGAYVTQHGAASSPIVVGNVLIVTREPEQGDGALVGLDRKTGAIRWKRDRPSKNAPYSTPMVLQQEGSPPEVVFTSDAVGVTSLDPNTGDLNWEVRDVFHLRCVASPVLAGGLIFQSTGNGGGDRHAIAVKPGIKSKNVPPKLAYELPPRGLSYAPTPVAYGGYLFLWGDSGVVTCIKPANGESVWSERAGTGMFFGSPICVNGKLYGVSDRGVLSVVSASGEFKLLGQSDLAEASHATPAVANGVLYLRTESHLISVGGKK